MSTSRQFKRATQRKRKKIHEINQKDAIVVEYFQANPIEFIETVIGIKLTRWQKIVLKMAWIANKTTRGKANAKSK